MTLFGLSDTKLIYVSSRQGTVVDTQYILMERMNDRPFINAVKFKWTESFSPHPLFLPSPFCFSYPRHLVQFPLLTILTIPLYHRSFFYLILQLSIYVSSPLDCKVLQAGRYCVLFTLPYSVLSSPSMFTHYSHTTNTLTALVTPDV